MNNAAERRRDPHQFCRGECPVCGECMTCGSCICDTDEAAAFLPVEGQPPTLSSPAVAGPGR